MNPLLARIFVFLSLIVFLPINSEETTWRELNLPDGLVADYIREEDFEGCHEEDLFYCPPWQINDDIKSEEPEIQQYEGGDFRCSRSRRPLTQDEISAIEKITRKYPTKSIIDICEQPTEQPTEQQAEEPESAPILVPEDLSLEPVYKSLSSHQEHGNLALATLEAGPSAVVGNCVNAISGDFFDSQIDLIVPGPIPLVVQRTYCSSEKKWHFRHMPSLIIGLSKGQNHICAGYQDDNGSGMTFRSPWDGHRSTVKEFAIPRKIFRHGLTNCGSEEISGQTNWKNANILFTREDDTKNYVLRHGSHVDRIFARYKRSGKHHQKGAPIGKFHLVKECHPNGNQLIYSYDKKDHLVSVKGVNSQGNIFSDLSITGFPNTKWAAYNGSVQYNYDGKNLLHAISSQARPIDYQYDSHDRIISKSICGRLCLNVEYKSGSVKRLFAPVGDDEQLIPTHAFTYESGITQVRDAKEKLTEYHYNNSNKRLNAICHYEEGDRLYSKDHFFWDDYEQSSHLGNLMGRALEAQGKWVFCRRLHYDYFGNIVKDQLFGNLSGSESSLYVDSSGMPAGGEVHSKTFISSQDGWNLPLRENDGMKWVAFAYYPNSNLLQQKFTGTEQNILKREFFEYDLNGTVIKEIYDDGISTSKDDLTAVSERHIKVIIPTTQQPMGLPAIVDEYYLDMTTGTNILLKRMENTYSPNGKLIQQKTYGSDGNYAFTLFWEYDSFGNLTKQTNALNETTTNLYDAFGNKIEEHKPDGTCKKFTYDHANRLIVEEERWPDGKILKISHRYNTLSQRIATIDIYGQETRYEYDALGRITKKILPPLSENESSPQEIIRYDGMGNAIENWDANGFCTKKRYTIRGQPYIIEYPDGSTEQKRYSLDGLLTSETGKNGLTTFFTHDALGRVIRTEVRDSASNLLKVTSATYSAFHQLSETDEAGLVTHYEYDGAGRRIGMTKGDHHTKYFYDSLGRTVKTIESIEGTEGHVTIREYDLLDRVIEERIEDGKDILKKEQYRYDANGNRTQLIAYTQAGIATTITTYTPRNEVTSVIDALGHTTRVTYDYDHIEKGQRVLQIIKTDPLGNQEIKVHNTHGKVKSLLHRNPFGDITQCETHLYDAKGQRLSTTSTVIANKTTVRLITTEWQYDAMGNCTHCIEAKGTPEQKHTRYCFNLYGQKESMTKPDGVIISYEYDALGRLSALKSSDIHYTYSYDIKDNPIHVYDHIHETATIRSYDIYDRLISETLDQGITLIYHYDQLDRLISLTLPDQTSIQNVYNAHYLTEVKRIKNNAVAYTHRYVYDLAGNVLHKKLIGNAGQIDYQHDRLHRVTDMTSPHWQETIPANGYDSAGNLLKRHITDSEGSYTCIYTYDDLYQLTSETGAAIHSYENDSLHNRVSKNEQPYANNSLHQLLEQQDCQYRYDANGNLLEKIQDGHTTKYSYDALDRLIEVQDGSQHTTYRYDSFHRRIKKDDITFLYQGQNEIGAMTKGTITQLRVLGKTHAAEIGAAIALELQGNIYVPIHDPYGNIVMLLDLSGKPIETYRYTAFGEMQTFSKETLENPWRYSSKRFDAETEFFYFGRRYYAPDIGRWTSPDPIGFEDGLNLYSYVHNHPLTYIDPDGRLIWFLAPIAISMAAEYFLPTAVVCLQQYAGGATAAALLTGLVKGYNGSMLEPSAFGNVDLSLCLTEKFGMGMGALLACNPGKLTGNIGKTALNTVAREATNAVEHAVAVNAKKCLTWFSTSTTRKTTAVAAQKTSQVAERHFVKDAAKNGMPSLDALSKAGQVMDRGGLTKAGRALDKHGNRTGSVFPLATGNASSKNVQGQFHLDDILTHPKNRIVKDGCKGYEVYIPDGRGAYFRNDGTFRGFIEDY